MAMSEEGQIRYDEKRKKERESFERKVIFIGLGLWMLFCIGLIIVGILT